MTQEKKPIRSAKVKAKVAGEAPGAKAAAAEVSAPLRLIPGAALHPCEAALEEVIGLVRARSREAAKAGAAEPRVETNLATAAATADSSVTETEQHLAQSLRDFEPEMAIKLHELLLTGRDARDVPAVGFNGTLAEGDSGLRALARDLIAHGELVAEYLRRGYALACAAGVPLERPVPAWSSAIAQNLDERAWLSFGRQLAKSEPEDWQCLALLDGKAQRISKLYLQLGDNAWWSFQTQIDRPSTATVHKEERAVERRRSKGMATKSLRTVAPQLRATEGRALRRAARAIRARVGEVTDGR